METNSISLYVWNQDKRDYVCIGGMPSFTTKRSGQIRISRSAVVGYPIVRYMFQVDGIDYIAMQTLYEGILKITCDNFFLKDGITINQDGIEIKGMKINY